MKNKVPIVFALLVFLLVLTACTTASQTDMQPTEDQSQVEDVDEQGEVDQEAAGDEVEQEPPVAETDAAALFNANCARCHGADRSGRNGPALLPSRLSQDASIYESVILDGQGSMPAFGNRLSQEEIIALVEFILTEPQ